MHKGFLLYNIMAPLMLSLAAGTNVYRPLQGTHGAASTTMTLLCGPKAEENMGNSPSASNHGATDSDGPNGDPEPPHSQSSPLPPPPSPPLSPSPPMGGILLPTSGALGDVPTSHAVNSIAMSCTSTTGTTSAASTSTASEHKQSMLHASQSIAPGSKKQW